MSGQVNFNLESLDDPVLPDGVPSFEGGQFSNLRANLLQQTQSKSLVNCDVDKLGKVRTRRGTIRLGSGPPSGVAGTIIQGLTSYQTPTANYVVAANNGRIWQWNEALGTWTQIAMGGTADNEDIIIYREGSINHAGGYTLGETDLIVTGLPAVAAPLLAPGNKLYFTNNLRTNYYEYTIKSWNAGTSTITLEEPGLVFDVKQGWGFTVGRPAKVNNGAGYAAGATSMAIDGYAGAPAVGEKFVIKSENITHTLGGGSTNVLLNFTPGLQAAYVASDAVVPIVFAEGNDQLFFCDGVGPIYGWNGKTTMNLSVHSILDDLQGTPYAQGRTTPPTGPSILLWFQNRLIASGIDAEPDAIYFSDFFDPTAWDRDYQLVRIGGGESDPITGLLAWTDYNMLVFKKNSCYVINLDPAQNSNPDDPTLLVASFSVKQLHKRIGCPAPLSAVQVGGGSTTPGSDVFFLDGDKKVHSIRRVMAAETQQEVGQAVSLPIQDVVDAINIDHIQLAAGMYHNEHYILGIPSIRGTGGGVKPNLVVVYNLLTQSWCGTWTWAPTCFSVRTDLGKYSKLIFGDVNGNVLQWLDDQSLDEETATTYQDVGMPIGTTIVTRALTFGDSYSYKTGLNVELEFDESVAEFVYVHVILDKVIKAELVAPAFDSLSESRLRLGTEATRLPFILPGSPGQVLRAFDLQRYGTWRELQFQISTDAEKLALRSVRVTGFIDTIQLQTVPPGTPIPRPIPPVIIEPPPLPVPGTTLVTTGEPADPLEVVIGDDSANVTVGP